MHPAIGFTVPQTVLRHAYLRVLPLCVVGLAIPLMLGFTTLSTTVATVAVLIIPIGGVYWYTLNYKWVYLSSSGIQGRAANGRKITIPWSENVTLEFCVASPGIKCISVQPMSKGAALLLPSSIATTAAFKAALAEVAPANHPLRDVEANAL